MGLRGDDRVISMSVLPKDAKGDVLTVCENGYGKRTSVEEYRTQSRAGLGLITIKVNERNGNVVDNLLVEDDYQIMVVTSSGKVIRTPVNGISTLGRNTQGVRIMRLDSEERVVALAKMVDSDDEDAEEATIDPADAAKDAAEAEAEAEADGGGDEPEGD